jgi:phosphatidylcholine synthase
MSGESKPGSVLAALAVHAFTASGAVLGLLALHAAVERRWTAMFLWLGLALVVDGIDGTFARALRVSERLPRISGEVLDLIVDYLTYVIVPAYALAMSGLLPEGLTWPLSALIALSSAFYFADTAMKTVEGGFRGFPAIWNIAAFVLFVVAAPPVVNAVAVIVLVAATFAPFIFFHPLRVRRLRVATFIALGLWCVAAIFALVHSLAPPAWVTGLLVASSLYFFAAACAFGRARPARDVS